MNALIYQRCSPSTYDEWASLGNVGWDWKSMQPYFEKSETYSPNPDYPAEKDHHRGNGPWKTRVVPFSSSATKAIIAAGDAIGVKRIDDLQNPNTQIGSVRLQTTVDENGRRHSTSQAYLPKEVRKRRNLTIGVGVVATKILLSDDGKRAIGVEFSQKKNGENWLAHASKEVIISTGTISTPQLLMLSGIGPREELTKHKIPVLVDLPGVGQNLTDHLAAGLTFYAKNESLEYLKHEVKSLPAFLQWAITGKGALTSNGAELALFFRHEDLRAGEERSLDIIPPPGVPDIEIIGAPINYLNHALDKVPQKDYISFAQIHLQPTSRGTITLKDASIWSHPLIDPNYCATESDHRAMIFGMKTTLKLAATEPLATEIHRSFDFKKPELYAHLRGKGEFKDLDDASLNEVFKATAFTIYHPTGTAKMGPSSDALAVVDDRLRVHGVVGLRVVDASIMPVIVRGHPQAPVVAIAEKASHMILEDTAPGGSTGKPNVNATSNDRVAAAESSERIQPPITAGSFAEPPVSVPEVEAAAAPKTTST